MRNLIFTLIALFTIAPSVSATEVTPAEAAAPRIVSAAPATPDVDESRLQLQTVAVEERQQASDDAAAAQLGPRGGFWWTVGVIVVAIIIVSVIL